MVCSPILRFRDGRKRQAFLSQFLLNDMQRVDPTGAQSSALRAIGTRGQLNLIEAGPRWCSDDEAVAVSVLMFDSQAFGKWLRVARIDAMNRCRRIGDFEGDAILLAHLGCRQCFR